MTEPSWGCSEAGGAATGPPPGWGERPDFRETRCLLSKTTGAVDPTSPGTCPAFPGLVVLFSPRFQEIVPDVKERGNSLPLIINHELGCDQNLSETKQKKKSSLPLFNQFLYWSTAGQQGLGLK